MRHVEMKYLSGEEIQMGDWVLWHGDPAIVEFVSEAGEFFDQFGGGCMIVGQTMGRVFEPEAD